MEIPLYLRGLASEAPNDYLATNPKHQLYVQDAAVAILNEDSSSANIDGVVDALLAWENEVPLALHLAAKLAKSRQVITGLARHTKLSVVFAVYKENHRLLTPEEHPSGEDFLRRKVAQIEWLASNSPKLAWELVAVDDGCPEGSGQLIEDLARSENLSLIHI